MYVCMYKHTPQINKPNPKHAMGKKLMIYERDTWQFSILYLTKKETQKCFGAFLRNNRTSKVNH